MQRNHPPVPVRDSTTRAGAEGLGYAEGYEAYSDNAVNWLAHVFLSRPDTEHRLGNLLADLVRGNERTGLNADFIHGAECHRRIDAFTDAHAIVRTSRARIDPAYRRFSGVLIDIFYDYFLASRWDRYNSQPLPQFTATFYAAASDSPTITRLPAPARTVLTRIMRHDLLGSYQRIDGVEHALRRISDYLQSRWQRNFALERAVQELARNEAALSDDFAAFFPQLQQHVAEFLSAPTDLR